MKYDDKHGLPKCAADYIGGVVRKVRYRKKIRADVRVELIDHFVEVLKDCTTDDDRYQRAEELITEFGDPKMLAKLIRRGKKRCRPMWKKVLIRTFQVFLCLIAFLVFRGLTLTIGKPTMSVDYIQWLNELVRDGRDESQNAYPHYVKAIELMPEEVPEILKESMPGLPENMTLEDEKIIEDFLSANGPAYKEVQKGLEKLYSWPEYSMPKDDKASNDAMDNVLWHISVPNLSETNDIVKRFGLRSNWRLDKGDHKGALDDALAIYIFSDQMLGQGLLIEQLVGIAVNAVASKQILTVLSNSDMPASELKKLQSSLGTKTLVGDLLIDMSAEKAFWYDFIQRYFTDEGDGNGKVLIKGLPLVYDGVPGALKGIFLFDFPDRKEITGEIEVVFEKVDSCISKTPAQLKAEKFDWEQFQDELTNIVLMQILMPAYGKLSDISWERITERMGLYTTVSVLLYESERGQYPTSLEQLVEMEYMQEVPIDPFSDKPLVYKKTDDGFKLYSFGPNMIDNGGIGTSRNRWFKDAKDAIFWPAEE